MFHLSVLFPSRHYPSEFPVLLPHACNTFRPSHAPWFEAGIYGKTVFKWLLWDPFAMIWNRLKFLYSQHTVPCLVSINILLFQPISTLTYSTHHINSHAADIMLYTMLQLKPTERLQHYVQRATTTYRNENPCMCQKSHRLTNVPSKLRGCAATQ
jgi:hypothetical protein